MTLDKWLTDRGETNAAFAEKINSTGESVRRYRLNKRWPTRQAMMRILAATGGEVTPNDFFDIDAAQSAAA